MKKLIAISVMLALVAGAVFAEASVGGNLKIGTSVMHGANDDGGVKAGRVAITDAYTNVSWSGDNAGGMMRLWTKYEDWTPDFFTFWWWKPIDQLRIQLGMNADGDFGFQSIGGWGFTGESMNATVSMNIYGGGAHGYADAGLVKVPHGTRGAAAYYGGFGDKGLCVSILPAPAVAINLVIPYGRDQAKADEIYLKSHISSQIGIPDIGTLKIAVQLQGKAIPDAFLAFYLSALDGMGMELGFGMTGEFKNLGINVGFNGNFGGFGMKAVVGASMQGLGGTMAPEIGLNLLPNFQLGNIQMFINLGMGMAISGGLQQLDTFVNPYIIVPANAGSFRAGFILNLADVSNSGSIQWGIPIGWNVYF